MVIDKPARAGTLESSDIYIMVQPNQGQGIEIQLDSIVLKQFGKQIENVMRQTLKDLEIEDIKIIANDRGALDYTIRARLETAINRAN
ncbi:citrate lyase acyl carrier protein [Schnuerera ultunensis]|uniref:Citrate lyase, acyl carrier (Gamma) subunit n=1 Tax=[Clostridium] ultunense Esp TaxID=1288971 RepID=A0A1M4PPY5_9FIRM|nr:citrate lyase acyl carrier protein [Schnuerera ultunensis]SHD77540.1 citrate lyase, acyl carrier (gamma) subunit [[Clostridium] ultunense Esp]